MKKRKISELDKWELLGTLDELTSQLGLAKVLIDDCEKSDLLTMIQLQVYKILCEIASESEADNSLKISFADVDFILKNRELLEKEAGEIRSFVIPGGTQSGSMLHIARTVARQAHRLCEKLEMRGEFNIYLNRMACLLFDLAVIEDRKAGKLALVDDFKK